MAVYTTVRFTLTLHNPDPVNPFFKASNEGFVDMKEIRAKSTSGEFLHMSKGDSAIVKRVGPGAFPR
jgi:hypothetical protein